MTEQQEAVRDGREPDGEQHERVSDVASIRQTTAVVLRHAGYTSKADLRSADLSDLTDIDGLSAEQAGRIKDEVGDANPEDAPDEDDADTDGDDVLYCRYCGGEIAVEESVCAACGRTQPKTRPVKNASVAVVASLAFAGLGHLYLRQRLRGAEFVCLGLATAVFGLWHVGLVVFAVLSVNVASAVHVADQFATR